MQKFVLLADRRSGTTLLIDYLNNLEGVHIFKRAFGIEKRISNPTPDNHSGMYFLYRTASFGRRIRHHLDRKNLMREFLERELFSNNEGLLACGFRLIYPKAEQYPEILGCLDRDSYKVIHLVRTNVLKTFVSYKTAPIHKMHHPRDGASIKTVTISLDPKTILAELRLRSDRIMIKRDLIAGHSCLEVSYEDLVQDRDIQGTRIQEFLGLPQIVPFQSDLVKINPDSLDKVIENFEEIRKVLAGTEFEQFLS